MLERSEYMPLGYFKKQKWTGSYQGMRFLFHRVTETISESEDEKKEEDYLEVVCWKEPFSYEVTPEEEKTRKQFPLSEEGREAAIVWLEEQYESRQEEWKQAKKSSWC